MKELVLHETDEGGTDEGKEEAIEREMTPPRPFETYHWGGETTEVISPRSPGHLWGWTDTMTTDSGKTKA